MKKDLCTKNNSRKQIKYLEHLDVLHVCGDFAGGGGQLVSFQTVKCLAEVPGINLYCAGSFTENADKVAKLSPESLKIYKLRKCKPQKAGFLEFVNYNYSFSNFRDLKDILDETNPNIIHLQNYLNLSCSIYDGLRKYKKRHPDVKILETLHGYYFGCPNSSLYDYKRDAVCEKCIGKKMKNEILLSNCYGAYPVSVTKWIRSFLQHNVFGYRKIIDVFLSPSKFLKHILLKEGIPESSIKVIPNPVEIPNELGLDTVGSGERRNEFVFIGRLSREKNLSRLIRGFAHFKETEFARENDAFRLLIIGDGPQKDALQKEARLLNQGAIEFRGALDHDSVLKEIRKSKFMVLPSKWYENAPLALIEGIMLGCFPIASNHGGMKEIISESLYGEMFDPLSTESIAEALKAAVRKNSNISKKEKCLNSQYFCQKHNDKVYKSNLLKIYSQVLEEGSY